MGNWEDQCIQLRNQQTCTSNKRNQTKEGPIFNPCLADASLEISWCFIGDLLMQQKFHSVNLIGRSWTWKTNQITPTYLGKVPVYLIKMVIRSTQLPANRSLRSPTIDVFYFLKVYIISSSGLVLLDFQNPWGFPSRKTSFGLELGLMEVPSIALEPGRLVGMYSAS